MSSLNIWLLYWFNKDNTTFLTQLDDKYAKLSAQCINHCNRMTKKSLKNCIRIETTVL